MTTPRVRMTAANCSVCVSVTYNKISKGTDLMASIDMRAAYELLRRALENQNMQHQRSGERSLSGVPAHDGSSYSSPQGGLLGRLRELEGGHDHRQPVVSNAEIVPSLQQDPSFRQLSRIPHGETAASVNPSYRSKDQTNQAAASAGRSPSPSVDTSSQNSELLGAYRVNNVTPWFVPSPSMTTVPLGWRGRRLPIPVPPMGSTQVQPLPVPAIPDWWIAAAKIGQVFSRGMYGNAGDGRDAYSRCIQAAEGGTEDWENFCRFLGRGTSNTAGGESQNRACWSKTFESQNQKQQWCENQFRGQ
jgi:hypothetical protein